jgi:hypothetical protein
VAAIKIGYCSNLVHSPIGWATERTYVTLAYPQPWRWVWSLAKRRVGAPYDR